MTTTHDIAALCAAIDQGDDAALPILADALEDAGDPRAAGLRVGCDNTPLICGGRFCWWKPTESNEMEDGSFVGQLADEVFDSLPVAGNGRDGHASFSTRSAAYLALAEALGDV